MERTLSCLWSHKGTVLEPEVPGLPPRCHGSPRLEGGSLGCLPPARGGTVAVLLSPGSWVLVCHRYASDLWARKSALGLCYCSLSYLTLQQGVLSTPTRVSPPSSLQGVQDLPKPPSKAIAPHPLLVSQGRQSLPLGTWLHRSVVACDTCALHLPGELALWCSPRPSPALHLYFTLSSSVTPLCEFKSKSPFQGHLFREAFSDHPIPHCPELFLSPLF